MRHYNHLYIKIIKIQSLAYILHSHGPVAHELLILQQFVTHNEASY